MSELHESQHSPVPRIDFAKILQGAKKYDDIEQVIAKSIAELKAQGIERIGFVSGPINNSKDQNPEIKRQVRERNQIIMRQNIIQLAEENGFPIFGSTDIFDVVWKELEEIQLPPEQWNMKPFFRRVLGLGVTDIFMIKGWRDSTGAQDEYDFSLDNGLTIHDLDPLPPESATQS